MKVVNFILSLVFGVTIMLLSSSLVNYSYNDLVREVVDLGLPVLSYAQIFVLMSFIGIIIVLKREPKTFKEADGQTQEDVFKNLLFYFFMKLLLIGVGTVSTFIYIKIFL